MRCFLCGKKIRCVRSWSDQQYCCANHREEARLTSARALRDEEDEEPWSVSKSRTKPLHATATAAGGQTASIFGLLTLGALAVVGMNMRGLSPAALAPISLDPGVKHGIFQRAGDALNQVIRSRAPITLHEDFHAGWSDWNFASTRDSGLRIWNRSTSLKNYQIEFSGHIEKKSLSWVFRAADDKNYYAMKLFINKSGLLPNAGLVHYLVMNGREGDRMQAPLPLTLERGTTYRVRVSVQDDRFITYLNGQMISFWTDQRLQRGGVGFFADRQDPPQVAWISLSEHDSILGRALAHFSLIVMPGDQGRNL